MGYHDRKPPDYMSTGIGVVNPLHEQQKKLNQLEQFLREMAEEECRSISSQIRFLIRNHVAQKKSTIDLPDRDTLEAINF